MITRLNKIVFILAAFVALTVTSCKKDKFDEPPHITTDPNIANATIADLRALFTSGNPIVVTDDLIISGVVTADDRSGNFYKQFVIQDSTGAIPVLVNKSGLYSDYPIGRKVYVKCKDLVLGQYGKNLQLGGYVDYTGAQPSVGNIASTLADKYIVKGPMVTPIVPRVINSISELNLNSDQSILIQLDPVTFAAISASQPYADTYNGTSVSRTIQDCDANTMDVRTSNFAEFANTNTPAAGVTQSIIGIYSVFGTSATLPPKKQFTIREIGEVQNSLTSCPGATAVDTAGTYITIADLKALYTVAPGFVITSDLKIRGSVISDLVNKNEQDKNAVVQDATAGIIVRFAAAHSFTVGQEVVIKFSLASKDSVIKFGGVYQAGGKTPLANAVAVGTKPIIPQVVTTSQLNSNIYNYESTLIKILNVSLTERSGGTGTSGTYNYSKLDANDGSTIQLYTTSSALFKSASYPTGTLSNIVAIATPYTTSSGYSGKEIKIRNTNDVTP